MAARRLDLVSEELVVGGTPLVLLRPSDPEALVDEETFRRDELMPYWAELWPSGRALADSLPLVMEGLSVVELGCGLGVPSLVASRRGAVVVAVDWSPDAIETLRGNAEVNAIELTAEVVSWSDPGWFVAHGPFDLVLAADVLYERRNVGPLVNLLPELGEHVLLADPGRPALGDFLEAVEEQWHLSDWAPGVLELRARI